MDVFLTTPSIRERLLRRIAICSLCLSIAVMLPTFTEADIRFSLSSDKPDVWTIEGNGPAQKRQGIAVPHVMNRMGKKGYCRDFSSTTFTYERSFDLPDKIAVLPRKFIRFERSNWRTTLYLNNIKIGSHDGGTHSFEMDITDAVKNRENRMRVVVDDYHVMIKPGSKLLLGICGYVDGWDFFRGICGAVELVGRNRVFIREHYTWGIVRGVDSPKERNPKIIHARTGITNTSRKQVKAIVKYTYRDDGAVAYVLASDAVLVAAGKTHTFDMQGRWKNPRLWWPDDPFLYDVTASIEIDGEIMDEVCFSFGFRDFYMRNEAFEPYRDKAGNIMGDYWLNGKRIRIFNDTWGVGYTSAPDHFNMWIGRGVREKLKKMKDLNVRAIRTQMAARPDRFLREADRLGMLIIYETAFEGHSTIGDDYLARIPEDKKEQYTYDYGNPAFWDMLEIQTRGIIRDVRQHPSVILWRASNEISGNAKRIWREVHHGEELPEETKEYLKINLAKLFDIYVREDPARDVDYEGEDVRAYNEKIFLLNKHYVNGIAYTNRTELPNTPPWAKIDDVASWSPQLTSTEIAHIGLVNTKIHKELWRRTNDHPFHEGEYFWAVGSALRGRSRLYGGFRAKNYYKDAATCKVDARLGFDLTMCYRMFRHWDGFGFFVTRYDDPAAAPGIRAAFRPLAAHSVNYSDALKVTSFAAILSS